MWGFFPGIGDFFIIWGFLSRGLEIFSQHFYPGDWGFLKSGNFHPRRLRIFENLGIFIPGILGDYFIPRIFGNDDFSRGMLDFENLIKFIKEQKVKNGFVS